MAPSPQAPCALAAGTPLSARTVQFVGAATAGEAYRVQLQRRHPQAQVTVSDLEDARTGDACDAIVIHAASPIEDVVNDLAERLAAGGRLLAPAGLFPRLGTLLASSGLVARPDQGRDLICADKPITEPLSLHLAALAPTLMDIRTRLPARELALEPGLQVTYEEKGLTPPPLPVETPKVMVIQRPWLANNPAWQRNAARLTAMGWVLTIEFDDHPDLVDAVRGISAKDGWLQFSSCHAVQTSTPELQALFRPFNAEVAVFDNAAYDLPPLKLRSGPLRIFYGALGRGASAAAIAGGLKTYTQRHPGAEFVVVGDRAVFDALPTRNKRFHDLLSFEEYQRVMQGCDVALSPLDESPINRCKSDAKYVDAAGAGLAFIGSPTVYGSSLEDGHDGLIAAEPKDWARHLEQLTTDAGLRKSITERAWRKVRDRRMFAHQIQARTNWYRSLWARRHLLTAGIMERAPVFAETLHQLAPQLAQAALAVSGKTPQSSPPATTDALPEQS